MSDDLAPGDPAPPGALPRQPGRAPGVGLAATLVTCIGATTTATVTGFLAVSLLWLAAPVFDAFGSGPDNPRWFVAGTAVSVLLLSGLADLVALFVLRGRRWARWVMAALCAVTEVGGVATAYYVAPLLLSAAAVAVTVLLWLPESRSWFRTRSVVG